MRETRKQRREREEREKAAMLEEKLRDDREKAAREVRERERAEADARAKAEREERQAKEKALDDKIQSLQTELTALEKTYLEMTCTFECMKIDLMVCIAARAVGETGGITAAAVQDCARELHRLQALIILRKIEHDALVAERNKLSGWSRWMPWVILGGMTLLGMSYWRHMAQSSKAPK